ncbi:MAG: hypothetical protein QNJ16_07160 [Rhodobacter sp.]|nr:hypothetical protein [Rhodobacter sp.]
MTGAAVFAGRFASQPLVFAHLLDAADRRGLALDLDHVEVIQGDPTKRLGHAFAPGDVAALAAARGPDDTLVVVFPEALIPGARLFADTALLRPLGTFRQIRKRSVA